MKKLFFSFFLFSASGLFLSQKLITVDKYGVMTDSATIKNLKKKYKIIGNFQKVSDDSEERRARVLKSENNYWTFIDQKGKEITPANYLSADVFNKFGYAKVKENISITRKYECGQRNPCIEEKILPFYYFIDKNGVQSSDYFDKINDLYENDDYFVCEVTKKDKILRKKDMEVIYESKGENRLWIDRTTYKFSEYFIKEGRADGKKDLVNGKGEYLTNFQYEDVLAFGSFYFGWVRKDKNYTWYLLNKNLQPYGEDFYTETGMLSYNFNKDVITLQQKDNFFLINNKGEIISEKYKLIRRVGELFAAYDGKLTGLINNEGKTVVPFKYRGADLYQDRFIHLAITANNEKTIYSVYDPKSGELFDESFYIPHKKYIVAGRNENLGIRDENLKLIIPKIYKQILPLGDSGYFLAINQQDKKGLLDSKNKAVIPFIYSGENVMLTYDFIPPKNESDINDITKYWIIFQKGSEFGVLNYKGETIIPFENNRMTMFSVPVVYKNGKLGLITKNKKRIPAIYDYHVMAHGEKDGFYFVKKNGKLGAVNENNKVIIPFEFEDIDEVEDELYAGRYFVLRKRDNYVLIDKRGKIVYPYEYFPYTIEKMKEGIVIYRNSRALYDIYKNKIDTNDLDENTDYSDFK